MQEKRQINKIKAFNKNRRKRIYSRRSKLQNKKNIFCIENEESTRISKFSIAKITKIHKEEEEEEETG